MGRKGLDFVWRRETVHVAYIGKQQGGHQLCDQEPCAEDNALDERCFGLQDGRLLGGGG